MTEEAFQKSTYGFTVKLFKEVSKEFKDRDYFVYSPLSIQSCLTMVYMGAEGDTAESIANVLQYNEALSKVDIACLIKLLMEQGEEDDSVEVANKILIDKEWKVNNLYENIMKTYFHSSIEKINLDNDKKIVKEINNWVKNSTHGKISEIMTKEDFYKGDKGNERKKMILLDVIHFKGRWAYKFDETLTKPRKFWVTKDEFVMVDTMEITNHFNYCRFDEMKFSVLEMNYVESELSLLIIIPDEPEQLSLIEAQADKLDIYDIVTMLYLKTVHVFLPKFTLEFTFDLKNAFTNLGMGNLFEANDANLNGIFQNGAQKEEGNIQCVDSIIHKAVIAVDEEGAVVRDTDIGEVEVIFDVNKPFYFCLKHKFEHNVVYSGCVRKF